MPEDPRFTWCDIKRIGKEVFTRAPKNLDEYDCWIYSLIRITASVPHIIRKWENWTLIVPSTAGSTYGALLVMTDEIQKARNMFTEEKVQRILQIIQYWVNEYLGWVQILDEEQVGHLKRSL